MGWKKYRNKVAGAFINPAAAVSNEAVSQSPLSPVSYDNVYRTAETISKNPSETFKYLAPFVVGGTALGGVTAGQAAGAAVAMNAQDRADKTEPNFSALSNEDLYRQQSEGTYRPSNPFEARNYDAFDGVYAGRSSPRVYATDNSFVFPNTPISRPNTALIPSTGEPAVIGGGSNAPQLGGGAEVSAQAAMPGAKAMPDADSVAAMFTIPQPKARKSATVVR